jgi:hypothetical protein
MKTPEKIYISSLPYLLDKDSTIIARQVKRDVFGVEYIRSDIAKEESEKLAVDFHLWILFQHYELCENEKLEFRYFHPFDPDCNTFTLNELFTEFLNNININK